GPFEAAPFLAIGVSGGSDSLALLVLASRWARARGGAAVGLTVDHGLRPEGRAEAERVGAFCASRGIRHVVLEPAAPIDRRHLQEAARAARYAALAGWCRAAGCLHLLVGHQRDDQAETLLIRLGRGSGADGLAGMSALRELGPCRLLRPLLGVA